MKKIPILIMVLIPWCIHAACTGSSPSWQATPDYASVSSCVSQATYNDTITVSSGSATWSSQLSITKGIKIIGAGKDNVTITIDYSGYGVLYAPDATTITSGHHFRLSGMSWKLNSNRWLSLNNSTNTGATVIIDNNEVSEMTLAPSFVNNGLFYGVIYGNKFIGDSDSSFCHFDMYGRDNASDWTFLTLTFGSAENIYWEDNEFIGGDAFFSHGHGGRSVIRYNSFTHTSTATLSPWLDIHGNQPSGVYASMGTEIYGNILNRTLTVNSVRPFDHRGGKALIFFNQAVTPSGVIPSQVREEFADSISAVPVNVIDGQPQHVSNSYYFNNRVGASGTTLHHLANPNPGNGYGCCDTTFPSTCVIPCTPENGISENRDYYNHNESFDGTSGVGCGLLASRPATCTAGVGYWATTQSCSNPSDYVGAEPATKISGTLYKCVATNTWEAFYSPYTYPHPLRGEGGEDPDPEPDPEPTGLILPWVITGG